MPEIFYQKYRPKYIGHLIGQEIVSKILTRACEKEFFHHSYLLSGKHGTGKTTVARIIASMLVCESRKTGSDVTCGKCPGCNAVHKNASPDVQEIDAASNSSVDNIRSVIESSRHSPQDLKKRVFIIDECHRLSPAAMSALLKTLEEPSSSSVFILCTTEFDKVLSTFKGRCQKLFFNPVPPKKMIPYLGGLFKSRDVKIDTPALFSIASASGGSVREALEISQEVIVLADGEVTEAMIAENYGIANRQDLYTLVGATLSDDLIKTFDTLERLFASNIDVRKVCREIGDIFRSIMLSKVDSKYINGLVDSEKEFISKTGSTVNISDLASFLPFFEEAERCFEVNVNNKWVLEAIIVKITQKINGK